MVIPTYLFVSVSLTDPKHVLHVQFEFEVKQLTQRLIQFLQVFHTNIFT